MIWAVLSMERDLTLLMASLPPRAARCFSTISSAVGAGEAAVWASGAAAGGALAFGACAVNATAQARVENTIIPRARFFMLRPLVSGAEAGTPDSAHQCIPDDAVLPMGDARGFGIAGLSGCRS